MKDIQLGGVSVLVDFWSYHTGSPLFFCKALSALIGILFHPLARTIISSVL